MARPHFLRCPVGSAAAAAAWETEMKRMPVRPANSGKGLAVPLWVIARPGAPLEVTRGKGRDGAGDRCWRQNGGPGEMRIRVRGLGKRGRDTGR